MLKMRKLEELKIASRIEALNIISELLLDIVERDFKRNIGLKDYVVRRVNAATDVLKRKGGIRIVTENEVKGTVPSTKGILNPPRTVKLRELSGEGVVEVKLGVPEEEAEYIVHVSDVRIKCTCKDAIITVNKSKRKLGVLLKHYKIRLPREPSLEKYVLCKHTISRLAEALYYGTVGLNKRLENTLRLGLFVAYLRITDTRLIDEDIFFQMLNLLEKREYQWKG